MRPTGSKPLLIQITSKSLLHRCIQTEPIASKKSESSCTGMFMETLRKKSFWGAMVFVAVFVTSIVVLLADNAMAR
jgi:hypothetical protein